MYGFSSSKPASQRLKKLREQLSKQGEFETLRIEKESKTRWAQAPHPFATVDTRYYLPSLLPRKANRAQAGEPVGIGQDPAMAFNLWTWLETSLGNRLSLSLAVFAVVLAALLYHHPVTASLLCLVAVSIISQHFGPIAGIISVGVFNLFLMALVFPETPSLRTSFSTTAFLSVASVICLLEGRLPAARQGESRALALVALSRQLSEAVSEKEVDDILSLHLNNEFGAHQVIWYEETDPKPEINHRPAEYHWLALPEGLGAVGLAKAPKESRLLEAFLLYATQTVQHIRLARRLHEAEVLEATEKLHRALLNSISHDLRIPLVSITGVLSGLSDGNFGDDEETRRDLVENALSEAERLNRLVANLLRMTSLESGALKVCKKPYDLWDVVTAVLDGLGNQLQNRKLELDLPDELPLVPQDPSLMGQVLRNLLDNAIKYSPRNSEIRIEVRLEDSTIAVLVMDRGCGIPQRDHKRVFEKFFRVEGNRSHGSGLGLSICEGLVTAHGGTCWVENRPGGGTIAGIRLPLEDACFAASLSR